MGTKKGKNIERWWCLNAENMLAIATAEAKEESGYVEALNNNHSNGLNLVEMEKKEQKQKITEYTRGH